MRLRSGTDARRLAIRAVGVLRELIIASSSRYFGTYPLVVGVSNRIVR
jgi:hypothetical protein